LKEKQIQEYKDLDIPIKEYWDYREGLSKQDKLEDKFDYIAGLDLPVEKKNIMINNIVDRKEAVDMTNYDDFSNYEEFEFATKNPEKYTISKVIGYESYVSYSEELDKFRAYKDENGKTISVSAKQKKTDYINSLDLDYGQKIILYRSLFSAQKDKDEYNADIVDYLNERDDISEEEMISILEALDMQVLSDGSVVW
jgi:hypothetical protein